MSTCGREQEKPQRAVRIAHVSTFPPLRCGIASYVSDLICATPGFEHRCYALHYGKEPRLAGNGGQADVNSVDELANLARLISESDCDLVSLQHEFGIWGGRKGENIHAFIDNLNKPLISVLHTTFSYDPRSRIQAEIMLRLVEQSLRVVVLTTASKLAVEALHGGTIEHIIIMPHGVPDVPYVAAEEWDAGIGQNPSAPIKLITPGFFRPDKGFEEVLYALRDLRNSGCSATYRIAGEPQLQFPEQWSYRERIERLVSALELNSVVQIAARYLSLSEQTAVIQESHLGVFPYQIPSWTSSGTIPLVMGMGRPVLCTPFEYARVKAAECPGVFLTSGFSSAAIAAGIKAFVRTFDDGSLAENIYRATRPWTWKNVGATFRDVYLSCCGTSRLI